MSSDNITINITIGNFFYTSPPLLKTNNSKIDKTSLKYIIKSEMTQSECVKLGILIEKHFLNFILTMSESLKDIRPPKNKKGNRDMDHLFIDENNKIIHYAELKGNVNLDTEKSESTFDKVLLFEKQLKIQYPEYTINAFLVSVRYPFLEDIPIFVKNKYKGLNLIGGVEYFETFGVSIDTDDYFHFLNQIFFQEFKKTKN